MSDQNFADKAVLNHPRRDARDKVTGRTRFTIDAGGSDVLHAALLRSDRASARIVKLNVEPARKMPGVRAIATNEDVPGYFGIGIADHPLLAKDVVRYHGEPIVAVAADTLEQARAAVAAIELELAPIDAVLTMGQALATDAALVHPDWKDYEVLVEGAARGGNVAWEATVERGDTGAAFARDDVTIVEGVYEAGRQSHVPFEPRVAVVSYEDGRYHVHASTQVPWTVRTVTARVLGISESRVRVTTPAVGGGFGLKFDASIEPCAAVLARLSGRSVKIANSRREEQMTCLSRENAEIRIRSAVTSSGEIVGREATVLMDCGAYGGEQIFLTTMTTHTLGGNYRLGSVKIASQAIYTNTPPNGAFRACNGVYNIFALERHTDEIADAIGMDRMEFRRRHVLGDQDMSATGQVYNGDVLLPMLERMETLRANSGSRKEAAGNRLYGEATTVGTWFIFVGPSAATVNLNHDGSATLVTSGVELGQGTMMQALPQIVAANLGIAPEDIIVKSADTDAAGRDLGVGGGRTTVSIGAASEAACVEVRNKLLDVASEMLQTPRDNLVLGHGRVEIKERPGAGATIQQIVAEAEKRFGPVSGSGAFTAPPMQCMPGCTFGHFIDSIEPVFAVHNCELAIDTDTGKVEILAYRVVQDVGRALNHRAIHGQIQGGVVQGFGYALHEEISINEFGAFDQTGFENYLIPLATDSVPVEFDLYEGAPAVGPLGTKGAGEIPILNVAASIGCAIANATGKQVSSLPLTPTKVVELIDGVSPPLRHDHISSVWKNNTIRSV